MKRFGAFLLLALVGGGVWTIVPPQEPASAASTGGPVFLDGTDSGYHGSVFYDVAAQTRTIQSGWRYYATWYQHLLASIPSSYVNDGTIAVLGTTGFNNDADSDFQHDTPSRSYADCGVGTFEVARSTGLTLRWFDGAAAIASFLDGVESGANRPALIHIVEHTPTAEIGTPSELCKFGLDDAENSALTAKFNALAVHVNRGGALFGNDHPYTWLTKLEPGFTRTDCAGNVGAFTSVGSTEFPMAQAQDAQSPRHNCLELSGQRTNLKTLIEDALLSAVIGGSRVIFPESGAESGPVTTLPRSPDPLPGGGSTGGGGAGSGSCVGLCVNRVWGEDRYRTALAAFEEYWPKGSTSLAVVAVGENYPDAITAGSLAGLRGAPILLARPDEISEDAISSMQSRGISHVFVVGGESVISKKLENRLRVNFEVTRFAGSDRYATSAAISGNWTYLTSGIVYVAPGADFVAQLLAGFLAARDGSPMMLVRSSGEVSPEVSAVIRRLKPTQIVLVSRENVDTSSLSDVAPTAAIKELWQTDPYDLSVMALASTNMMVSSKALLVTGEKFPDALTGIAVSKRAAIPLVLMPSSCVPTRTKSYLQKLGVSAIEVLGGSSALFEGIETLAPSC